MSDIIFNYVSSLLRVSFIQLAGVFGVFFIFGFILAKLQNWTSSLYLQTVGWKGILWTAWIGENAARTKFPKHLAAAEF